MTISIPFDIPTPIAVCYPSGELFSTNDAFCEMFTAGTQASLEWLLPRRAERDQFVQHCSSLARGKLSATDPLFLQLTVPTTSTNLYISTLWKGRFDALQDLVFYSVSVCSSSHGSTPPHSDSVSTEEPFSELDLRHYWDYSLSGAVVLSVDGCKLVHVNPAFCSLLKFSPAELVGRKFYDLLTLESQMECARDMAAAPPDIPSFSADRHHICKDGSIVSLQWFATRDRTGTMWYCQCRDVTETQQLERERKMLLSFFDRASDSLVVLHRRHLSIQVCNQATCRLLGKTTAHELKGSAMSDFVIPEDREAFINILSTGSYVEARIAARPSRWISCSTVHDNENQLLYVIVADITDRKRREQGLIRDNEQKSAFLAIVSEEVRFPVHSIKAISQILSMDERIRECAEIAEHVQQIHCAVDELMLTFENLVAYSLLVSRSLSLVTSPFEWRRMLMQTVDSTRNIFLRRAKSTRLTHTSTGNVPRTVLSDERRIGLLLSNVIIAIVGRDDEEKVVNLQMNAIPGTPSVNKVWIDIICESISSSPSRLEGSPTHQPRDAQMLVKQSAADFVEHNLDQLKPISADSSPRNSFDMRSSVARLHMSIASSLVQVLGGILVTCNDVCRICIPVVVDPEHTWPYAVPSPMAAMTTQSLEANGTDSSAHRVRILCVDDDMINQRILSVMLKRLGFRPLDHFVFAGDGKVAVDEFKRASEAGAPFHVVLLDLNMPEMDGFEACREIRRYVASSTGDTKLCVRPYIAALTASTMEEDRIQAQDAGFDLFLSKPLHLEVLREVICAKGTVSLPPIVKGPLTRNSSKSDLEHIISV